MRLGIDFGTTRTRVAAVLKGNYPLITFHGPHGDGADWYPSLLAVRDDRAVFGWEAQAVQLDPAWEVMGSCKRLLGEVGPEDTWTIGGLSLSALEWLTRYFQALRQALLRRSNLELRPRERLEAVLGIPANANSSQRFLTLEAARQAGFELLGMLNEPSAAGIEYAHRYRRTDMSRRREHVVVYDLGGGTFDVAVVCMAGTQHEVLASEGIARLGGDDLDARLLELVEAAPGFPAAAQTIPHARLLPLCREAKEAITANTRKVTVDLGQLGTGLGEILVPIPEFAEACTPLLRQTVAATERAMEAVLGSADGEQLGLAAVYLVGGSSELPLLARTLRDRFGRRVRRSPYPPAATAIGLAIAADEAGGYTLTEKFTRHFGVWREAESGRRVAFDPVFPKLTPLPRPGEPSLVATRRYRPAHTLGRFRFLECSGLTEEGEPTGDLYPWREVLFPFDPALAEGQNLRAVPIERRREVEGQEITEEYRCSAAGVIEVTIANLTGDYHRTTRIR